MDVPQPTTIDDACSDPTPLDQKLAGSMFALTVLFLVLTAGALHFGSEESLMKRPIRSGGAQQPTTVSSDAIEGIASAGVASPPPAESPTATLGIWCALGVLGLYPLYLLETLWHWRSGATRLRQHGWFCVLPPLRLGARDHASGESIWLPGIGWSVVDDDLRRRAERGAHTPMLIVALLVLPLLVAQHYLSAHLQGNLWLTGAVEFGAAVSWFAFTLEFIVMLAIAERRWTYARQHWLDLLIICFPFIAFLRFIRTWSIVRVLRLGRMQQAAKVFRLRGTAMRLWRAILLLELLDRLFRQPERRLNTLRERLAVRERELEELRQEISALESRLADSSPSVAHD